MVFSIFGCSIHSFFNDSKRNTKYLPSRLTDSPLSQKSGIFKGTVARSYLVPRKHTKESDYHEAITVSGEYTYQNQTLPK